MTNLFSSFYATIKSAFCFVATLFILQIGTGATAQTGAELFKDHCSLCHAEPRRPGSAATEQWPNLMITVSGIDQETFLTRARGLSVKMDEAPDRVTDDGLRSIYQYVYEYVQNGWAPGPRPGSMSSRNPNQPTDGEANGDAARQREQRRRLTEARIASCNSWRRYLDTPPSDYLPPESPDCENGVQIARDNRGANITFPDHPYKCKPWPPQEELDSYNQSCAALVEGQSETGEYIGPNISEVQTRFSRQLQTNAVGRAQPLPQIVGPKLFPGIVQLVCRAGSTMRLELIPPWTENWVDRPGFEFDNTERSATGSPLYDWTWIVNFHARLEKNPTLTPRPGYCAFRPSDFSSSAEHIREMIVVFRPLSPQLPFKSIFAVQASGPNYELDGDVAAIGLSKQIYNIASALQGPSANALFDVQVKIRYDGSASGEVAKFEHPENNQFGKMSWPE